MLWGRYLPTSANRAATSASADATDRKVNAIQGHHARVLAALEREVELYRLDAIAKEQQT
jgi:hypothetical protein